MTSGCFHCLFFFFYDWKKVINYNWDAIGSYIIITGTGSNTHGRDRCDFPKPVG